MTEKDGNNQLQGWLWKWTNYMKGYQHRWFMLSNGLFSYYHTQNEMAHTCRGTINLAGAFIVSEQDCNFMVSNGASQTFHLRASSPEEKKNWVTALESAKLKAMIGMRSGDDDSSDESSISKSANVLQGQPHRDSMITGKKLQMHHSMNKSKALSNKLDELFVCNELIAKHNRALQHAVDDIESFGSTLQNFPGSEVLAKKLNNVREQATLFNITSAAMLSTCSEFFQTSEMEVKSWPDLISEECDHVSAKNRNSRSASVVENSNHNELLADSPSQNGVAANPLHDKAGGNYTFAATHPPSNDFTPSTSHAANLDATTNLGEDYDDEEFLDALNAAVATKSRPHAKTLGLAANKDMDKSVGGKKRSSASSSPVKQYRTKIPEKPEYSLNVWNVLKNCIGKDLSKIPMPVNFNEPLSFLQRLVEDIEYYKLIHSAAKCTSALEQMAYVVALSVSTYCSTKERISKPFNPLLGETFDYDRRHDLGFRAFCEQVSHHPLVAAMYAESADCGPKSGWSYWTEIHVTSKFRGKYLSVNPLGTVHLKFHDSGNHYTWEKITTTVHNIIVGTIWVDQSGESIVRNHKTGDLCKHKYIPYSYFSSDSPRRVTGVIQDKHGASHYLVSGAWDSHMDFAKIDKVTTTDPAKPQYKTQGYQRVWEKETLPKNANKMYYFSEFAMSLNEEEEGVAPTDSRFRPDQRAMEDGNWDLANSLKLGLEETQRKRIRRLEKLVDPAQRSSGQAFQPLWFNRAKSEVTNEMSYNCNGKYWTHKARQDWSSCPDIFTIENLRESLEQDSPRSSKTDLANS